MDNPNPSIQDLTRLMLFSGRLSSVHIENMKSFPFIYFNDIEEVRLEHNISTTKDVPSSVSYDITLRKQSNDNMQKRYEALLQSLRAIFWKELNVRLTINGEEYKNE